MLAALLRPEERRRTLQYLVGALQFSDFLLELLDPIGLGGAHSHSQTVIDIGLLDPRPDGLDPVTQLRGNPRCRPMLGPQLGPQRPDHPHRTGLLLRRIPPHRRPP